MNTLHLIFKPHSYCDGGIWTPADHISQEIALKHFSGGSVAIAYNRLDEIIYIAGIHGWNVTTEGDPKYPHEENQSVSEWAAKNGILGADESAKWDTSRPALDVLFEQRGGARPTLASESQIEAAEYANLKP